MGLGKKRDYFDHWFIKNSLGTFRTIHYLPRAQTGVKVDKLDETNLRLTTPCHADTGFITLLSTFGYPGLQVMMPDGKYRSVKPLKNHLVVNLGNLLSQITDYKLKATMHRVVDIGCERWSSPFFMEPKWDAKIPTNILKEGEEKEEQELIEYGVYSVCRLRNSYVEWSGLKLPGEEGFIPKKLER